MRTISVEQYYPPQGKNKIKPFIRLKGDWLREAGIEPGMKVNITIENNQVVIKTC